ncbi:hypothetical protein SAMN04487967_0244 [Natronorubrum sediminis]|uniref:Uncharacterized protein n=1 Tax=Natronorubrum sediminis TaxID=640943 RepID=A0A1H6FN56_9EURY|nr:hypothetical protein [Natronorubrum sediminis]SEH11204.1 hypothetical protein SAMN04487967_0244 [Natronorubrum sediminis]
MFPAYRVLPEDILEVLFAISELGPNPSNDEISRFANLSNRKVREAIKILETIGIIDKGDNKVEDRYERLLQQTAPKDWSIILEKSLLNYQPFIDYSTYLNRGYTSEEAAQKVYAGNSELASKPDYLKEYFELMGKYTGIVLEGDELSVEIRNVPADMSGSLESLRKSLKSELEVKIYLDEFLGENLMEFLDQDTKTDLADAYLKHSTEPRDSVSASGRAFEDFLRNLGETYGDEGRDYSTGSGIVPLCNHLQGDGLVRRHHKRRIMALAEIRNKGGAHGDDAEALERWEITPEVSLDCALTSTILTKSVYRYAVEDDIIL